MENLLKNLEELRDINVGDIIGMGQLIGKTIPALCIEKDEEKIKCLGNMDGVAVVEYDFRINKVEGFYDDGSLRINFRGVHTFFKEGDKNYQTKKQILINNGGWKEHDSK